MNVVALLSLIADLYAQNEALQLKVVELEEAAKQDDSQE
jgi:hypothetical protein